MTKIFKIIYYLVIAFLVAIALLFIVSAFPITGNIKVLSVLSGSMDPAIHTGSIVVVKPVSTYKIGDIITFGPNTKTQVPTTHRIYDMKVIEGKLQYITKGDANNAPDQKVVLKEEILGKVLLDIPYLGFAVDFTKKPIGFILIIGVPAVAIIADEIKKIFKETNKKNKI